MDSSGSTALIVAGGVLLKQVMDMLVNRQRATIAKERHAEDVADREKKNNVVLGAIAESAEKSEAAIQAGHTVTKTLLTMDERLASLVRDGETLAPIELGRLLIEMKANADTLEAYAHGNVHRLNNLLAGLQARLHSHSQFSVPTDDAPAL